MLERENKDLTNLLDLQIKTNIKSSKDIHVRYTENIDDVTKSTESSLILKVMKGKVQIHKYEKKNRDDVKKSAGWIKYITNKILKADEDIKYVGIGERVYLRKRTIGRNKLQPYRNDKEWIVTGRTYNIYEIQYDEGKHKVINKEILKLFKPKYIDWKYKCK